MGLVLALLGACQLHFSVLAFAVLHFTAGPGVFVALWVARVVGGHFSVAYACAFTCARS